MTTKIKLYNRALGHLGTIRLNPTTGLTENRKERYELDAVYDEVLQECLEEGLWKFATRTVKLDADPSVEPEFGPAHAFARPDDYVRALAFASDENLKAELPDWIDENGVWYADIDTVYLRYVSNGTDYGLDLGKYPEYYAAFVGARLALRSSLPITRDKFTRNDLLTLDTRSLAKAKKLGAVNEPVKTKPVGRLVQSRLGRPTMTSRNGRLTWS